MPDENAKLFQVKIECGKYIDMVPGNTGKDSNMGKKEMKFGRIYLFPSPIQNAY